MQKPNKLKQTCLGYFEAYSLIIKSYIHYIMRFREYRENLKSGSNGTEQTKLDRFE